MPFKGLILGDDVDKVNRVLGKPARVKSIASPQVSLFEYQNGNYSVEVDKSGRLYSIRIFITEKLLTVEGDSDADWREFKAAIIAKDFVRVIAMLRPDVEIYRNGKVLAVNQKHSDFTENPDKEIIDALVGNTDSVLQEIVQTEPESELRLAESFGMGSVYKFYKGRILAEIAFFPYNGRYRVYEIAFRNVRAR